MPSLHTALLFHSTLSKFQNLRMCNILFEKAKRSYFFNFVYGYFDVFLVTKKVKTAKLSYFCPWELMGILPPFACVT